MNAAELKALKSQVVILNKFMDTWAQYDDASPTFEDHIAQAMTNYQQAYAAAANLAGSTAKGMYKDIVFAYVLPKIPELPVLGCLQSMVGTSIDNWVSFKSNPSVPSMFFESCVVDEFKEWVNGKLAPFFGDGILGVALQKTIMDGLETWIRGELSAGTE